MDTQRIELLARIADLYYNQNLRQEEVARRTGYSRSMISRLLTEARDEGVVEIRVNFPLDRCADLEKELRERFHLKEARVLARGSLSYEEMLRQVGVLAARLVESLLNETIRTVGVSWGTALWETANAMRPTAYAGVQVVQVIGALDAPNAEIDGPDLARKYARLFGGYFLTLPVPLAVHNTEARDALLADARVRRTLDMAKNMDMLLAGMGSMEPEACSILRAGYLSREEVLGLAQYGVAGDVCGVLFDCSGNLLATDFGLRRVGLSAEDIIRTPIKIGIGGGKPKALPLMGACQAGLINYVVTDEVAALGALRAMSRG
ncbi:MAG: sugar-binding protein [Chloroflexi bacterium]|nr:sugar-binding protein [Chloroflexota bacterium]